MKHLNISIRGKVQGVFFRLTTKAVSDQVGVRGFVVNLNGSVYIGGEGDEFALDSLVGFCQEGPEGAIVESVEVKEGEMKGFSNFEVVKRVQS